MTEMETTTPLKVHKQSPGRVAGIDYGTVRIGIAISDPNRILASPYETYTRKNVTQDAEYFRRLMTQERIVRFVVGLPVHLNGQISQKATEAVAFAKWLHEMTALPVDFVDERFTTKEAEQHLRSAKLTNKRRKDRRDRIAAQILLTTYLESGAVLPEQVQGLDD
ncbi:MAG: Holliday junction resolvase RuvX [Thermoguttaceae bacterium]